MILDSDFLIALLRGDKDAVEKAESMEPRDRPATTSVNTYELFKGAMLSEMKEKNMLEVENLLSSLRILPFDYSASQQCAKILVELKKSRVVIDMADQMIAAIAVTQDEAIVTRNSRHFSKMPGIKLAEW